MSTEYSIKIYRKLDDKEIGEVMCNYFKSCLYPGCRTATDLTTSRFTTNDLDSWISDGKNRIAKANDDILKKTMMIPLCKNTDMKRELEDEIKWLKEDIDETFDGIECTSIIVGQIYTVVEDLFKRGKIAYQYNMDDLNKGKTKEEQKDYLWAGDVYFKIFLH